MAKRKGYDPNNNPWDPPVRSYTKVPAFPYTGRKSKSRRAALKSAALHIVKKGH